MDATTPVVVDTDVISFRFKNHSLAPAYQVILSGRSLAVSLISLAEIEYGMEFKNWGGARRELMRRFLGRFTFLLPDTETAGIWARIKRNCERKGRPIAYADAWVAASAVQLNVPLVTHNASDYNAVDELSILTAPTGALRPAKGPFRKRGAVPARRPWTGGASTTGGSIAHPSIS